jgi:hypothetical protein
MEAEQEITEKIFTPFPSFPPVKWDLFQKIRSIRLIRCEERFFTFVQNDTDGALLLICDNPRKSVVNTSFVVALIRLIRATRV